MYKEKELLIIASDIGRTAPGIVYKTILNQLAKEYHVNLITPTICEEKLSAKIRIIPSYRIIVLRNAIENMMIQIFGTNPVQKFWAWIQMKSIPSELIAKTDLIVSFISFHHYGSVMLGSKLASKYGKKHIVYSVDAIPAPMGWITNSIYYVRTQKLINRYLSQADAFFSSNEQMLSYQISLASDFEGDRGVLYTPIRENALFSINRKVTSRPVFLYTGGLYGPRKYDTVIEGFKLFIRKHPNAILRFVGSGPMSKFKKYSCLIETGNIEICSYSSDLLEHYNQATVLIDINAYFDNDVFLSSKIINYLPIKKPIISITGDNSPSRNVFRKDSSIIHSHHNPTEICDAMELSISIDKIGHDRNCYIDQFSVENCLTSFRCCINTMINLSI